MANDQPPNPTNGPQPYPNFDPNGSRERQIATELNINTGTIGLIATLTRILAGLSTDKVLTLFVASAFGWLLFSTLQQTSIEKASTARMYEDSRERDRRHCSDREDKITRDRDTEAEKMRTWFAAQAEVSKRFEAEQREKDRAVIAELSRVIAKKFPNECP